MKTVVLIGNPNVGKTAVFNALTGARQKVSNWPGVTVEKRTGICKATVGKVEVLDLPGVYTLCGVSEWSEDKKVTRDYLLERAPNLIVNVVDAANLERNLYLSLQLLALGIPMITLVNRVDLLARQGITLVMHCLENELKCPVFALSAWDKKAILELKETIVLSCTDSNQPAISSAPVLSLDITVNSAWSACVNLLEKETAYDTHLPKAWVAEQLLTQDPSVAREEGWVLSSSVAVEAEKAASHIRAVLEEEPEVFFAEARYKLAHRLAAEALQQGSSQQGVSQRTERIDYILTHRYWGLPLFLLLMYGLFMSSINIGGIFQDFFTLTTEALLFELPRVILHYFHGDSLFVVLLLRGLTEGLGTVFSFIPVLGVLFFLLACLEDSGYMARAAFVIDRIMQYVGLPGKSFIPLIVGFGCNVPAVMSARGVEGKADRTLTVLMTPFMSCGARLAIFSLFAGAFFPVAQRKIIFLLYCTGIVAAVFTGWLLRKTLLPGERAPLLMELPLYQRPRWRAVFQHAVQRVSQFLRRGLLVIVPVCLFLSFVNSLPMAGVKKGEGPISLLAYLSQKATPFFAPMGIQTDNWPAVVGLATGIAAKEVVIGTLNTLYRQEEPEILKPARLGQVYDTLSEAVGSILLNLRAWLQAWGDPLAAAIPSVLAVDNLSLSLHRHFSGVRSVFSYLLFILLYFPCISTMVAIAKELGLRWAVFSVVWSLFLAYWVAAFCYQIGGVLQADLNKNVLIGLAGSFILAVFILRNKRLAVYMR